jgi:LmbE family N-acetylglucosaminyl deacetylase
VLVVVAHPDDESFGCGSLLLHAADAGAVTSVVCATRGEAGQITEGSGATHATLPSVREQELRTAAELLGVSQVELLDYRDSGMAGEAHPATLVGAPFEQVRDQVQAALVRFAPDIVITLDASDGHRDHARIRDVTLAAVAELTSQPGDSRTAPWTPRVYLHCLPQSLMKRWFAHMAQQNPESPYLGTAPGTPEELITTVIDTSAHLAQREQAMKAHASQTSPYEGLPADLRRAFLTTDQLQRVTPPWTGGERESDIFGGCWAAAPHPS